MSELFPSQPAKSSRYACEPAATAGKRGRVPLPAGIAPADRDNLLSLFPDMADRIAAAARPDAAGQSQSPHDVA